MRSTLIPPLVFVLASTLTLPHALACSCIPARLARTTLPADGAVSFPTDGVLRVFLYGFPRPLRGALSAEYRLTDAQGAEVALDASVTLTRLDLRPHTALRPHTRYTLSRLYAYDDAGTLMNDTERLMVSFDRYLSPSASAPSMRRAWFPEVRFATGEGPATTHAALPSRLEARASYRFGGGDCGPGVALNTTFRVPSSTLATDVAALEIRAQGYPPALVATMPAQGLGALYASDLLCTPDPAYIPSSDGLEARVVVVDATGATVGETPWTAARTPEHRALPANWESDRRGLSPDVGTLIQRWRSPPIVQTTATGARGPASCAYGFEVTSRRELAPEGASWAYESLSTLAVDGERAWVTINASREARHTRLLAVPTQGAATVLRPAVPGYVSVITAGPSGPLLVRRASDGAAGSAILSLDRNGRTLWQRSLRAHRDGHRIAASADRVLVLDRETESFQARPFGWTLLDARTGAPIGAARDSNEPVIGDGSVAAAWVRDRFVIAWTARSDERGTSVKVATMTPDGTLRAPATLPISADGPIDLAASGDRVALVSANEGVVSWTLLDSAGAVQRGPIAVSGGVGGQDNRKPRVSARDDLFVVSWEAHPTGAVYAAAVDVTGALSAALTIADNGAGTVFVAPQPGGAFLASYASEMGVGRLNAATLRCRATAPPGAPQRIATARAP